MNECARLLQFAETKAMVEQLKDRDLERQEIEVEL